MRTILLFLCLVSLPLFYTTNLDEQFLKYKKWQEEGTIIQHFYPADLEVDILKKDNKTDRTTPITEEKITLKPYHRMKVLQVESNQSMETQLKITVQIRSLLDEGAESGQEAFEPQHETSEQQEKIVDLTEEAIQSDKRTIWPKQGVFYLKMNGESPTVACDEQETRLIYEDAAGELQIDENTLELLQKDENEDVYIISAFGVARSGKSWFLETLRNKFDRNESLGHFVQVDIQNQSITTGMNIATVKSDKFNGKIVLIDSEGWGSLNKDVDPKLMFITAMISNKLLYITKQFTNTILRDLSEISREAQRIHPDSGMLKKTELHMILNMYDQETKNFKWFENIDSKYQEEKNTILEEFGRFPRIHYVGHSNYDHDVENDMNEMYETILDDITNATPMKMGEFLTHVKKMLEISKAKITQTHHASEFEMYRQHNCNDAKVEFHQKIKTIMAQEKYNKVILSKKRDLKVLKKELNVLKSQYREAIKTHEYQIDDFTESENARFIIFVDSEYDRKYEANELFKATLKGKAIRLGRAIKKRPALGGYLVMAPVFLVYYWQFILLIGLLSVGSPHGSVGRVPDNLILFFVWCLILFFISGMDPILFTTVVSSGGALAIPNVRSFFIEDMKLQVYLTKQWFFGLLASFSILGISANDIFSWT